MRLLIYNLDILISIKGEKVTQNISNLDEILTKPKQKKYEVNPFVDQMVIKTRGKKMTVARGSTLVDMTTGEIEGVTEIAQIVEVDEGQFIKLFTKDLAFWFELSKGGMRVFGALLTAVQTSAIGRDIVFLDVRHESLKTFGISRATFYRGIDELLEKGFIAKHLSSGWYFINPSMFFNGNRARFVREYRKKEISTYQKELFTEVADALPAPAVK